MRFRIEHLVALLTKIMMMRFRNLIGMISRLLELAFNL